MPFQFFIQLSKVNHLDRGNTARVHLNTKAALETFEYKC